MVTKARELISAGAIGPLTAVNATWLLRKHDTYYEAQWRREAGGGFILINLIHEIDNLRFIAGEIESVQAIVSNARRGFAVADTAAVLLRFSNGALGTLTASDTTPSPWAWEINSGENVQYPHQPDNCYAYSKLARAHAQRYLRAKGFNPLRGGSRKAAIKHYQHASAVCPEHSTRVAWLKRWLTRKNLLATTTRASDS